MMRTIDLTSIYNLLRTQRKQELLTWYEQLQAQGAAQGKTREQLDAEALAQLQGRLRELALLTEAIGETSPGVEPT